MDNLMRGDYCCTRRDRTFWVCKKILYCSPHLLRISLFFMLPVLISGQIFVCSFPGMSNNMTVTFNDSALIPGTTAFYSCDFGFTLVGEPTRNCMYDGSWTGGSPVCAFNAAIGKQTNQSSTYKDAWISQFAIDDLNNTCSGTESELSPYWILNLGQKYQVHMIKIIIYDYFPLTNFDIVVANSEPYSLDQFCFHHEGKISTSEVTILCNKPIIGQFVRIEQQNPYGLYLVLCNVEILVSDEIDCGGLSHIPNGFVQYLSNLTVEENKAKYVCEEGYQIIGNSIRTCFASGYWSGAEPFCKPVDCGSPPQVRHTNYQLENNLTSFKSLARYHCEESMTMAGEGILLCNNDAQWEGDAPECEDIHSSELFTDLAIKIGIGVGVAVVLILLILIIILLVVRRRQSSTTFRSEHNHENDLIKVKAYELVKTGDNALYPTPAPRTNIKINQPFRKPDEPDLTENLLHSRDRDSRTFTKL